MVVKLGTTSPLIAARGITMVELATINKSLSGDSPEQPNFSPEQKKAITCFKQSMHLLVFLVLTISDDD